MIIGKRFEEELEDFMNELNLKNKVYNPQSRILKLDIFGVKLSIEIKVEEI